MTHKLDNPVRVAELAPADTLIRVGLLKGSVFCDIGAGTGVFALPAAEISKSAVYAVEISEKMREVLREKSKDIIIVDSIRAVPDASCDVALLCTVLHELDDIPDMAVQIRRVLKKRGILAVIEFHKRPTTMGPPVVRRLSEEDTATSFSDGFIVKERFDLGENFYCVIFCKGS